MIKKQILNLNKKAFTLIELLVVVAIIGILAAVGVVAYNGYALSSKIEASKFQHQTIKNFIEASYAKCALNPSLGLILKTSSSGCSNCVLGTMLSNNTIKRSCGSASNVSYFFTYHFNYEGLKNTYALNGYKNVMIGGDLDYQCCLAQSSNPIKGSTYIWGDNNLGKINIKTNIGNKNNQDFYLIETVDWPKGSGF